jgi:DNA-binding GntR family transcriptional regulator
MNTSKKIPISEQAYKWIKDAIVTCELKPGQTIVQGDLANRYEIGITPVREALRQLSQDGFVQPVPRMGYQVSQITNQDIEEIFELRSILETQSVRLAAIRAPIKSLEVITKLANFTYQYQHKETYLAFLRRNTEFHFSIAVASGNQRLADQISKIMEELNRVFHLGLDISDSAEEMRNDHQALANALMSRDANLAEELVMIEITRSHERVKKAINQYQNQISNAVFINQLINSNTGKNKNFGSSYD